MTVRPPRLPVRPRLLVPVLAIVVALLILSAVGVTLFTDYLWFSSVGYEGVFTTVLRTRILLFFVFGLLMGLIVGVNIWLAHRSRPPFRPMSLEQQNLERYRVAVEPFQRLALIGIGVVLGIFGGLSASGRWQTWLLWRNRTDFGIKDPQFHKDISYYTFTYPMERFALNFFLTALVLALVASTATHYLYGGLRVQTAGDKVSPAARVHLSVLLGFIVLAKAVAYYLDRFGLVFSTRGVVKGGASYTDVNAVLPAKNILIGVAVICALLFFANIRVRNVLLPGGALALLVLAAVLLGGILPAYTQQFRVKPNQVDRERQYIARNIEGTRAAYGLTDVEVTDYGQTTPPLDQVVTGTTVPNARLLDPNRLTETFEQLQKNRNYFGVSSLDIDRYPVDGVPQDFVVAAREVDQGGLTANQRNWVNERLTYTHGNGLIMAQADQTNSEGVPVFGVPASVKIDQPRIYFGENSPDYSVVGTKQAEIDGPGVGDDSSATFRYNGDGGVKLSSLGRKIAYALKFRDTNLLVSSSITGSSRIMYDRSPRERVKKVAPFLEVDSNPYPAVVDGRIVWIVDAYTTSNGYPYAQSVGFGDVIQDSNNRSGGTQKRVNYIRNSVKATVDAYSGEVVLYEFGAKDPVLQTWNKAFGGDLIRPQSAMSDDLLAHIRYPEDLFKVQRTLLAQYHVTDPDTFFNKEDQWDVPNDPAEALNNTVQRSSTASGAPTPAQSVSNEGDKQPPYYSLMAFPGDAGARFRLSTSFVFTGRQNLAAYASVSSDPASYGKIHVLQLPQDTPPNGPIQIANAFLTNPGVSQYLLNFRSNNNAQVNFGNLLTLPLSGGLLYIQPVYVQASGNSNINVGYPTLQQVLVAYGNRVAQGRTLQEALTSLLAGADSTGGTGGGTVTPTPTPSGSASPSPSSSATPAPDLAAAIKDASDAFAAGQAAFGRGDFAAYGVAQAQLKAALDRLTVLRGGITTPTPTPTPSGSAGPGASVTATPTPPP